MSDRRWMVAAAAAVGLGLAAIPFIGTRAEQRTGASTRAAAGKPGATGASAVCDAKNQEGTRTSTLTDMNGQDVNLADYKGKVILHRLLGDVVRPLQGRDSRTSSSSRRNTAKGLAVRRHLGRRYRREAGAVRQGDGDELSRAPGARSRRGAGRVRSDTRHTGERRHLPRGQGMRNAHRPDRSRTCSRRRSRRCSEAIRCNG